MNPYVLAAIGFARRYDKEQLGTLEEAMIAVLEQVDYSFSPSAEGGDIAKKDHVDLVVGETRTLTLLPITKKNVDAKTITVALHNWPYDPLLVDVNLSASGEGNMNALLALI